MGHGWKVNGVQGTLNIWRDLKRFSLDFFASSCPLCQRSTAQIFCLDCQRQILACQNLEQSWNPIPLMAWGTYQGALKRAIAQLKYKEQITIARFFGDVLADLWMQQNSRSQSVTAVSIPLHLDRYEERGYNQAELVTRRFCHVTGLPHGSHYLQRVKPTQAQFSLSRQQRYENLRSAFKVSRDYTRKQKQLPILLMDDIYTTGATLTAATQALTQAGFKVTGAMVIAKTAAKDS